MPVPISPADGSVEQVLAAAPKVQNRIPEGSTWDGTTDLPMDEGTFRQVISDMEPPDPGAAAPGTARHQGRSCADPSGRQRQARSRTEQARAVKEARGSGPGGEVKLMAALSEWLQIMLAEIARKRDDLERAREEDAQSGQTEKVVDRGAHTLPCAKSALQPTSERRTALDSDDVANTPMLESPAPQQGITSWRRLIAERPVSKT